MCVEEPGTTTQNVGTYMPISTQRLLEIVPKWQVLQFEDWMKEEKINLQKCLPSKERILRMAAYNRIVRSFRSSHFTEELQAHKMWRITNLAEYYDPPDALRVPEYKGQYSMLVLPPEAAAPRPAMEPPSQNETPDSQSFQSCESCQSCHLAGFDPFHSLSQEETDLPGCLPAGAMLEGGRVTLNFGCKCRCPITFPTCKTSSSP